MDYEKYIPNYETRDASNRTISITIGKIYIFTTKEYSSHKDKEEPLLQAIVYEVTSNTSVMTITQEPAFAANLLFVRGWFAFIEKDQKSFAFTKSSQIARNSIELIEEITIYPTRFELIELT